MIKLIDRFHLRSNAFVQKYFFRKIFAKEFFSSIVQDREKEYVFIIMARAYERYGSFLIHEIHSRFPESHTVLFLADLVHTMRFTMEDARNDFDIICSFDEKEAEKYGFQFVLEPFSSRLTEKLDDVSNPEYDVTFVGAAKNRYSEIISLYEALNMNGLKCDFHITEINRKNQKYKNEIHYGRLDFESVLKHVKNAKCVAEIMQKGAYSGTTRYAEAMLFGRNLITDCKAFREPLNKENNIFYFEDIRDIPFHKITRKTDYNIRKYEQIFSVRSFVNCIDMHLESFKKKGK